MQEHGLGTKTDAVCIVPIFDNGDFLVTREFRYAINGYCVEFPAGLIDPGETPVEAAKRDLIPKRYSLRSLADTAAPA